MQPRRKRPAGITLDDDVDEEDEDDMVETEVPSLMGGLDLDAIIDSGEPVLPFALEGVRITADWLYSRGAKSCCCLLSDRCMC